MSVVGPTPPPAAVPVHAGAVLAAFGPAGFVLAVLPLHFLQPGYDARYQLMSELALGPHGWAMLPAFLCLAVSALGLQAALRAAGAAAALRVILAAAALCFAASGVFPLGRASQMHILSIAAAFVLSCLAMYLYPSSAGNAARRIPKAWCWGLAAGVAAGVALGHSLLPMGIGQRLAAACLLSWFAVAGWRLRRL